MQELIQILKDKTGLTSDKAQEVITHVLNFVKSKLPDSLHEYIDTAVGDNDSPGLEKGAADKMAEFSL